VNPKPGPIVVGPAVILTGDMLDAALRAVLIASRARIVNGLPVSAAYDLLAEALAAARAAAQQCDVAEPEPLQHYPRAEPTVTVEEAARQLGLSRRQTQRLAPKLGGRLVGGRWFCDEAAVVEHLQGRAS
jgi:hypothetical protein